MIVLLVFMDLSQYFVGDTLKISVHPNSKETKIVGWDVQKKALRVNIKSKPDKGKANLEIVKFFKKLVGKQVGILKGFTSREKVLEFFD